MKSDNTTGPLFPSTDALVAALKAGAVDGIVVDLYTAGFRSDLFSGSWFTVSKTIDYGFTCGVVLGATASRLEPLFREYAVARGDDSAVRVIQQTQKQQAKVQLTSAPKAALLHFTTISWCGDLVAVSILVVAAPQSTWSLGMTHKVLQCNPNSRT